MKDGKSSDSILGVDIKEVQKTELEILLEFDRICKKHNINYQLFAGTLIGAVRHKGFIPWDDDIDVNMLRSEYNKFLAVVEDELSSDYFFQTVQTDINYMNKFAKIRKNNTVFKERLVKHLDMHHGVYIDIFAFDNIEPHSLRGKTQISLLRTIDSFMKYRNKNRYQKMEPGFDRNIAKLKYRFINGIPLTKLEIENKVLKIMNKFNDKDTEYVGDLANPSKSVMKQFKVKRSSLENSIPWEFEGHMFPIPKAYDQVLLRAYGDYMQLPPKEAQFSHHDIVEINLDTKK